MTALDVAARDLHQRRHANVAGPTCPRCERDTALALEALPDRAELYGRINQLEAGLDAALQAADLWKAQAQGRTDR